MTTGRVFERGRDTTQEAPAPGEGIVGGIYKTRDGDDVRLAPAPKALEVPDIVRDDNPFLVERGPHHIPVIERAENRPGSHGHTVDASLDQGGGDGG